MILVGGRSVVVGVLTGGLVASLGFGCVRQASGEHWRLMQPPEVSDPQAPKGVRLLPKAPLAEWRQVTVHPSEVACRAAKKHDIEREVKRARAKFGDDAKFALPLRRAVSSRCVREE
jgi:hypothetical protein